MDLILIPNPGLAWSASVLSDAHLKEQLKACRRVRQPWAALYGLYLAAEGRQRFGKPTKLSDEFNSRLIAHRGSKPAYRRNIHLPYWMDGEYHLAVMEHLIYVDPGHYLEKFPAIDQPYAPVEIPWPNM